MTDMRPNPHTVSNETYDPHIIPAETAARQEREGEDYKQVPDSRSAGADSIDTTAGYSIDSEGLSNNYAIEPEMYYEVPGDAREQLAADAAARQQELTEINQTDEEGKLNTEGDRRGKGVGII